MKKLLAITVLLAISCDKPDNGVIQEDCYCSPDVKQESTICKQVCSTIQDI